VSNPRIWCDWCQRAAATCACADWHEQWRQIEALMKAEEAQADAACIAHGFDPHGYRKPDEDEAVDDERARGGERRQAAKDLREGGGR
jgi:hypothetical protein